MSRISSTQHGDAVVIHVSGRLDALTAPEFQRDCLELFRLGGRVVVLDLGELQYISSAGIRTLLILGTALEQRGGTLRPAHVSGAVRQVFELSGFCKLFPCFDSVQEATAPASPTQRVRSEA